MKVAQSCHTLCDSMGYSPGQNTGVSSLSLLQGISPTQETNPGLPHCRQIPYQLNHQRSPRILEWVAYPFFKGSSWPRNQTGVSCIAGGFFTSWATREAITSIKWCNQLCKDLSELLSCFAFFLTNDIHSSTCQRTFLKLNCTIK